MAALLENEYPDGSVKAFIFLFQNERSRPATVEDAKAFNEQYPNYNEHGMVLADGNRPGLKILFPNSEVKKPTMVLSPGFVIHELNTPHTEYKRAIDEARAKK